jgi:hypothetical protein
MKRKLFNVIVIATMFACAGEVALQAQYGGPVVNIGRHHGNLRNAQENLVSAYQFIGAAQQDNHGQLGGHAERAKELITEADQELRAAATYANQR